MNLDETIANTVRGILTKWADAMPGKPIPDLGAKLSFVSVAERPAFIVRLLTLYDIRQAQDRCTLPYEAGLQAAGGKEEIWKQPVDLRLDFFWQETTIRMPLAADPVECPNCAGGGSVRCEACAGSATVPCPECMGAKRKSCPQCGGLGKLACTHCKGTGLEVSGISAIGLEQKTRCQSCSGTGGPPCPTCASNAGECAVCGNTRFLSCQKCSGAGNRECAGCAGRRQVVPAQAFKVEYQPIFDREIRLDPETPQGLLPPELSHEILGKIIHEAKSDSALELGAPLPRADLQESAATLLKRSDLGRRKFAGQSRIIKQLLALDRIPVYQAVYEYEGKKYSCWATALENRVAAAESPFLDLAARWAQQAQELVAKQDFVQAEALIRQASALNAGPWSAALQQTILQGRQRAAGIQHDLRGLAAVAAATLLLALACRGGHNLFWPLAVYAGLTFSLLKLAARPLRPYIQTLAGSLGSAVGTAALTALLFLAIAPTRRLDAREFRGLIQSRFGTLEPIQLKPEDESYLRSIMAIYEPLGVDVGLAQTALEANARRIEADRQETLRQEESRRLQAAAELQRKQELKAAQGSLRVTKRAKNKPRKLR
ncbi:MAG: hypothetical protein WC881_05615 [Elusimicrobiota bacterium]|jgi:hypothetical protein